MKDTFKNMHWSKKNAGYISRDANIASLILSPVPGKAVYDLITHSEGQLTIPSLIIGTALIGVAQGAAWYVRAHVQ